jgi:GNAT superfamily N-acetyltransferase
MGQDGDLLAERLARGCRCFGAWLGPDVVAYGWLSTRAEWIGELELEIEPGRGEAYVWNCVTLPAHRQKGMFRALLLSIAAEAKKEGLVRLWIGSIGAVGEKAVAGAGFLPMLRIDVLRLPWLRRLTVRAVEGADPGSVAAARRALANRGRPLGLSSSVRRARSRRH